MDGGLLPCHASLGHICSGLFGRELDLDWIEQNPEPSRTIGIKLIRNE